MKKNIIFLFLFIIFLAITIILTRNETWNPLSNLSQSGSPTSYAIGEKYLQEGKFDQAISFYSGLIKKGENPGLAYYGRGNAYMGLRRFDEAIDDYSNSLNYSRTASVLASRCTAYRIYSLHKEAEQDCQDAIKADPQSTDAYLALAFLYLEQGKNDQAQILIDQLLKIDPNSAMGYFAKARVEMVQGPAKDAISSLTKAIELDPTEPQFYWERGFIYYSNGMIDESEADMQKLIEIADPEIDGELMMQAGFLMNTYSGSRTPQP